MCESLRIRLVSQGFHCMGGGTVSHGCKLAYDQDLSVCLELLHCHFDTRMCHCNAVKCASVALCMA